MVGRTFRHIIIIGLAFTRCWRIRRRFRLRNPNGSLSNVMRGRNTVAVYTKRQKLHEDEFARDTRRLFQTNAATTETIESGHAITPFYAVAERKQFSNGCNSCGAQGGRLRAFRAAMNIRPIEVFDPKVVSLLHQLKEFGKATKWSA
jgi:hypothetical protein